MKVEKRAVIHILYFENFWMDHFKVVFMVVNCIISL